MAEKFDVAILGAGPGGYVAALRACQLKKRVALIEKDEVGGVCMNYGCIPTKYLLSQIKKFAALKQNKKLEGPLDKIQLNWPQVQAAKKKIVARLVKGIEFLLQRNGVTLLRGTGYLLNENQIMVQQDKDEIKLEAARIILAPGSQPAELPFLAANGRQIITSRQALELEQIPPKLLVIGAGVIGLEMGLVFQQIGSEVHILEIMPSILPGSDKTLTARLERLLRRQGLNIYTQMRIEKAKIEDKEAVLEGTCLRDNKAFNFRAEKVLMAVGRKPNLASIKNIDLGVDEKGFLEVNSFLETETPGIFAIGDVIGGKLLAHKASHEGLIAAENACGQKKEMNYEALPAAVYTEPEFSMVGLSEEEATASGIKFQVGIFSLQANGRALTMEEPEGMIKIIADDQQRIIGAHLLAPNASELIAEMALAVRLGLKLEDISSTIHVHPTLSEAIMEAALKAQGKAIHALNE